MDLGPVAGGREDDGIVVVVHQQLLDVPEDGALVDLNTGLVDS